MKNFNNIGLYLSNTSNKKQIIRLIMDNQFLQHYIDLSTLKGTLHSTITIEKLVDEELRHDRFVIQTAGNKSLQSMSSGQQKRSLLSYLIAQYQGYMVLDDVYSNIDKETQLAITKSLTELSETTVLIQLFFRKRDVLPCMDTILSVNERNEIVEEQTIAEFINADKNQGNVSHHFTLPKQYAENHVDVDPLIQLNSISVRYGEKEVLDKVSWEIRKGEFWQLVGPNGSGKSTLITMISGDNPKAYGQDMTLFGRKKGSGETIWDIKRQIGYFTPSMINQFTRNDSVENMIISGLMDSVGLYTVPSEMQKDMAKAWIEMLGPSFRNKSFQSLSIGQQRMVMVARAMVKHPPLLILDEPTIELDDENSRLFIDMVNAIAAEKQLAIIYVSHRDEEDLKPERIFELVKAEKGYTGIVKKQVSQLTVSSKHVNS
ncbi:MAG: ATP-binding cassette domain-containing protein [Paludibacter sp.]